MFRQLRQLRARLRYRRFEDDVRRELDVHRSMSQDAFSASGLPAEEARASAARLLGNIAMAREDARGVWLRPGIEHLWRDLVHAIRRLRRTPMFTVSALATLALGIGANIVIFSVVEGVLLRPLPYTHADELVVVGQSAPGANIKELDVEAAEYLVLKDVGRTLENVGLYQSDAVSVTGAGDPERVEAVDVTDDVLPALGVTPMLGHNFGPEDGADGQPRTIIVTYTYWRDRLGSDAKAVGRTLTVGGQPNEIIGVLPRSFQFLDEEPRLLLPLSFDRGKTTLGNFSYSMLGRLRPGATPATVNAEIASLIPVVNRTFPAPPGLTTKIFEQAHIEPNTHSLKREVVGDIDAVLWTVLGTTGLVLLIACANVANLLLVRGEGRRRELAIRVALGANPGRIAAGLIVESLALGMTGGAIGLALASAADRALVAAAPSGLPRLANIGVDGRVVFFSLGIAMLSSVLFSIVPILKQTTWRVGAGLRLGGRTASQSGSQQRTQNALVSAQVALALVVLVGSGLMVRTYLALTAVAPGFTAPPAEVQTFRISIPWAEVKGPDTVSRIQQDMVNKIAAVPDVASVGLSSMIPMSHIGRASDPVFAEGRTYAEGVLPPVCDFKFISPGYLGTLGIAIVAGRDFNWADINQHRRVVIVSEKMAREYWPDTATVVGHRIRAVSTKDAWSEVVGVVADTRDDGLTEEAPANVYWPPLMDGFWGDDHYIRRDMAVAIRSPRAGSAAFMSDIRHAVWSVKPNLPLANVTTLETLYRKSIARTTFTLVMLLVAGTMGLLLGIVGLYSVIAYAVSQRTREIGIRAALGARPAQLTGVFVLRGLRLAAIGLGVGCVAAFFLARAMSSVLFHVSPADARTYVAACVGLAATAAIASYLPARRALRVDPARTLNEE